MSERLVWIHRLVALWSLSWLVLRAPFLLSLADLPAHRWHPLGVLAPIDSPPSSTVAVLVLAVSAGLAILVLVDRGPRAVVLPVWALGVLLTTTWSSSWGHLFHTEHLLAVHALILGIAALPRRVDPAFVVQAMAVATVTTYVVAGVAKLRGSGEWLSGDILREQVAFDNLRKAVIGSGTAPVGTRLVDQQWLWRPLAICSLVVELGAPVALINRRLALLWVSAAWLFHVGIVLLMAIAFPYPLSLVAYAPLLPLEDVAAWARARRRRPAPLEVA